VLLPRVALPQLMLPSEDGQAPRPAKKRKCALWRSSWCRHFFAHTACVAMLAVQHSWHTQLHCGLAYVLPEVPGVRTGCSYNIL